MIIKICFNTPGCLQILHQLRNEGPFKTSLKVFQNSADLKELAQKRLIFYSEEDGCVHLIKDQYHLL